MRSKNSFIKAIAFLLVLSLPLTLSAQEGRGKGRVRGEVHDEAGNPIEGAKIVATHLQSGTTFTGTSDERGNWAVAGLGTGYFRFTVSAEGYGTTYHETRVSQFAQRNPPIKFTLKKVQVSAMDMPAIQDEGSLALFEEGNQLYEQEKYDEAVVKFEEFLAANPTIFQINLNIGNCYREMGDFEKAMETYNRILDKVKEDKGSFEGDESAARALASIGETYIKKGDLEKASEYLKQSIAIFPEDETLAFNVGEIYFNQREIDKAIEYYQMATKINEKWGPPYRQMGYAYLNKGDYRAAVDSFKKFIQVAPDDPKAPEIEALIPKLEELIK
ncbi:MAG: tetratricopeptide repeat protein [Candidatus Aminicenantes bacterium]